jgi:hypothetical protein
MNTTANKDMTQQNNKNFISTNNNSKKQICRINQDNMTWFDISQAGCPQTYTWYRSLVIQTINLA